MLPCSTSTKVILQVGVVVGVPGPGVSVAVPGTLVSVGGGGSEVPVAWEVAVEVD